MLNKINVLRCAFRKFNTEYRLFLLRKGLFLFHFVGWKFVPEKCNQQDGEYGAQCHNDRGCCVSSEQVCVGDFGEIFPHEAHLQGGEAVVCDVQEDGEQDVSCLIVDDAEDDA